MTDDEERSTSTGRTASGTHTEIGVVRRPNSDDPFDVDELPDDPDILKSRIERLELEIQHLVALSEGVSSETQGENDDIDTELSGSLENLNTQLSQRLDGIEGDISSLKERYTDESLLEEYDIPAILLQVQLVVGSFFIMLNFINPATAGGIALLLSTFLQFGHRLYLESENSSRKNRARQGRL